MELKEYQGFAHVTCAQLGLQLDLSHMVIGMTSEYEEITSALKNENIINFGEEIADVCWYFANYCTFRQLELPFYFSKEYANKYGLIENISRLNDVVKKFVAYGKDIDLEKEEDVLFSLAANILNLCDAYGIELEKILQNNIDKLEVRYQGKFSAYKALNRDLEAELKELEK